MVLEALATEGGVDVEVTVVVVVAVDMVEVGAGEGHLKEREDLGTAGPRSKGNTNGLHHVD